MMPLTDRDLTTILVTELRQKRFQKSLKAQDDTWKCVADYCQNHAPDREVVRWLVNRLRGSNMTGDSNLLVRTLIVELQENHRHYHHVALPQIGQSFSLCTKYLPNNLYLELCEQLFNQFATALNVHIKAEEELFEHVIEHNCAMCDFEVDDHHDETEALSKIINMLERLLDNSSYDPCSILHAQLKNLENDLKVHGFIEEELLFPMLKS